MNTPDISSVPRPIPPTTDLRDMLRRHLIARSLACMERAAQRRREALATGQVERYRATLRAAVAGFYGELPCGPKAPPVRARLVSTYEKRGYRLENVLFESFPGWEVNATVYVPLDFAPPFPAVIIPVGHSGKQFESYQLPAQFFARSGYLAVLFDPPGQASEKRPGNDHFVDGVRCYLVGESSSRYFIGDALRCIDYVASRPDVELSHGVAMTGVSGGGHTTAFAALLDERITVCGPSCCLSPLADLDITQSYAGCPETHMFRRYAEGVDEVDLLCAGVPTPTLLMAGELDEVFRIEDTRRLAEEVRAFYQAVGAGERFEFFIDHAGHCYSLAQARQFTRFMDRWLRGQPERPLLDLPDAAFALDPYEELQCHPRQDVHMRSLTLDRAKELERRRDDDAGRIRRAARALAVAEALPPRPQVEEGQPFRVWTHDWQPLLLRPEPGIELPATFLSACHKPAPTLLHFDDQHRHRLLRYHGPLARAMGFLEREADGASILAVDLRGWGDTAPTLYPYELASWGRIDRTLAYMSNALGDPLLAQRIRDGLAALAYLRGRPEVNPDRLILSGSGLGGVVALHVAAIAGGVRGVVVWDSLVSFRSLLEAENYPWPADAFLPNALLHYDLPELAAALECPVWILNPLDGTGAPLSPAALAALNGRGGQVRYLAAGDDATLVRVLREAL